MTVTLELSPTLAARLQAESTQRGLPPDQIILDVLDVKLPRSHQDSPRPYDPNDLTSHRPVTHEELLKEFDMFEAETRDIQAHIPDEMLRREHLYEDHDLG
jgi:hypothetical protein